tara:strand:- start:897 stop:1484 length:588 start_codon:yes stop_codon:yes gene_type:complete
MPVSINGNTGVITGLAVGGLPDGCITADDLASGAGGKIVNYAVTYKTDTASSDVSYPTRTGDLIFIDYAAANSNNKLLIMANLAISNQHSNRTYGELYIGGSLATASLSDASSSRGRSSFVAQPNNDDEKIILMHHNYIHGGSGTTATSTTRYSYRFFHENSSARTVYLNRSHNDSDIGSCARSASSIVILEVSA